MNTFKRLIAIEVIKAEFAIHGYSTARALRAYIDNLVGYEEFQKASRRGLVIHEAWMGKVA